MDCWRLKGMKEREESWSSGYLYLPASRCHSYGLITAVSHGFQIDTPDLILPENHESYTRTLSEESFMV